MSVYRLMGHPERGMLRIRCPLCQCRSADVTVSDSGYVLVNCLNKVTCSGKSLAILKALNLPSRRLFAEEIEHVRKLCHVRSDLDAIPDCLPDDELSYWYERWLSLCPLLDDDRERLLKRGFTEGDLIVNGYGSWRGKLDVTDFPTVGLPGVHKGKIAFTSGTHHGILIPCRDLQKRIVSLKIRLHDESNGKIRTFSSSVFGGSKGRSVIHCPLLLPSHSRRVLIVEGELKADLVMAKTGLPVLSVPGVNTKPERLDPYLDELGCDQVILIFDLDEPGQCASRDYLAYHSQNLATIAYTGFEGFKGIDDALNDRNASDAILERLKVI